MRRAPRRGATPRREAIEACLTAGMIAAGFERGSSSYVFALAEDVPR